MDSTFRGGGGAGELTQLTALIMADGVEPAVGEKRALEGDEDEPPAEPPAKKARALDPVVEAAKAVGSARESMARKVTDFMVRHGDYLRNTLIANNDETTKVLQQKKAAELGYENALVLRRMHRRAVQEAEEKLLALHAKQEKLKAEYEMCNKGPYYYDSSGTLVPNKMVEAALLELRGELEGDVFTSLATMYWSVETHPFSKDIAVRLIRPSELRPACTAAQYDKAKAAIDQFTLAADVELIE